MKTKLKKLKCI